jgi:ribosomal protein L11 methyltransferase
MPLAAAIAARLAPGGTLVLSGILVPQADEVRAAYPQLRELARLQQGDWCALLLAAED